MKDEGVRQALHRNRQIVFQYTDPKGRLGSGFPWNPNCSIDDIAGIGDPTGELLVLCRIRSVTWSPRSTRCGRESG